MCLNSGVFLILCGGIPGCEDNLCMSTTARRCVELVGDKRSTRFFVLTSKWEFVIVLKLRRLDF